MFLLVNQSGRVKGVFILKTYNRLIKVINIVINVRQIFLQSYI